MTPTELDTKILMLVHECPMRISALVSALGIDRDTVHDAVYALTKRGVLRLRPDSTLVHVDICGTRDEGDDPCLNPAEEPGRPCTNCRVFAQMCKDHDDALNRAEDPRKTALKDGLRQLRPAELRRLLVMVITGTPVLVDRDAHGLANYSNGVCCPLALAVGVPDLVELGYVSANDASVAYYLTEDCGFYIYNTRGIAGEYYTTNRREDLLTAAREVLEEKEAA